MSILSCQRASELTSASMDRRLTLGERAKLRGHQMICRGCRAYRRQLAIIRQALRVLERHPLDSALPALTSEARARIQLVIDQASRS
jgi:hypothetical protein